MTKVSIELDLKVVQSAINAKVGPAVEAVLAKYNLPKLIQAELEREVPGAGPRGALYYWMNDGMGAGRPLIENLIEGEIQEAAHKFVKKAIKRDSDKIEAAFTKMLRGSPDALARTLLNSLEGGLKDDWSFEISTKITPKEPERDYD